jgi:hypothetical protein
MRRRRNKHSQRTAISSSRTPSGNELREDGGKELREDSGTELRE